MKTAMVPTVNEFSYSNSSLLCVTNFENAKTKPTHVNWSSPNVDDVAMSAAIFSYRRFNSVNDQPISKSAVAMFLQGEHQQRQQQLSEYRPQ